MRHRLTVVIPASDRRAGLGGVLLAVASAEDPAEEVLVIETENAGPAAARNEGAERAMGDILVFVDSDVEIHRDALTRIRAAFEGDPGLTAVFGSYDDRPPDTGVGSQFRNLLHHHIHHESAGPATTFWAGLGAIRRDAFLTSGGFDERYTDATMEDIELGMRISATGGRILLDPLVRGTHHKAWSVGNMLRTDLWGRGTPWVRLLLRRRELPTALNLSWRHRFSALLSLHIVWKLAQNHTAQATLGLAGFLALNHRFHLLLWRRGRTRTAMLGLPLHILHHLTAVAAVASGAFLELFALLRGARRTTVPQIRAEAPRERSSSRPGSAPPSVREPRERIAASLVAVSPDSPTA